jgi:hypothetical protein
VKSLFAIAIVILFFTGAICFMTMDLLLALSLTMALTLMVTLFLLEKAYKYYCENRR